MRKRLRKTLSTLGMNLENKKIFNVGLPKTGTSSFEAAMTSLDYRVIKAGWGGWWYNHLWKRTSFPHDNWDCLSNFAEWHFEQLDRRYPDAKFVLTLRDIDGWCNSVSMQLRRDAKDDFHRKKMGQRYRKIYIDVFRSLTYHESHFKQLFLEHQEKVCNYCEPMGEERFLILRLEDNDKMKKLCKFLGKSYSHQKYPHEHKTLGGHEERDG